MTINQVIQQVDELKPNRYKPETKTGWISDLEELVQTDIMMLSRTEILNYTWPADENTELLAIKPHGKIYILYVSAQIDYHDGEYAAYENSMAMFNSAWDDYKRWFLRSYHPADTHHHTYENETSGTIGQPWQGYYLTAYGIAVKHGFRGTEEEWLDSLTGAPGADVLLRYNPETNALEWTLNGTEDWKPLTDLADLQGKVIAATMAQAESARDRAETAAGNAEAAGHRAETAANDAAASRTACQVSEKSASEATLRAEAAALRAEDAEQTARISAESTAADRTHAADSAASAKHAEQSATAAARESADASTLAGDYAETAKRYGSGVQAAAAGAESARQKAEAAAQTVIGAVDSAGASAASAAEDALRAENAAARAEAIGGPEGSLSPLTIVDSLPEANEENYKKAKLYLNGDALSYQIKLQTKPELTGLNDNLVQYYPYCSAASFDKYVYLFGGRDWSNGKQVNTIIKYDTETGESKILPEVLPKSLMQSSAINMNNYIYIIGGSGSSSIYKFNCKTEKLEEENAVLPAPNFTMGLGKQGKFIFIFGGNKTTSIYQFDTENHKVVELGTKLPQGCYNSVVGVYGKYAYVIPAIPNVFDCVQVWKFDLYSYSISTISLTSGFGRIPNSNGAIMGDIIYTAGHKSNAIKQYRIDSDAVIPFDAVLSDSISNCVVVNAKEKIYILGGASSSNGRPVLSAYKISADEKYGYATLATTAQTAELTNAIIETGGK